jgi:hypothetical protein
MVYGTISGAFCGSERICFTILLWNFSSFSTKRQISVKSGQSNSWFIYAKKIIWKYNLPEIYLLLEASYTKAEW